MPEVIGWRGRFFEDFTVGDIFPHQLGRTITDADNIWFTCVTMNTNPTHFDANISERGEFGKILVNSCFTLSLAVGPSASDLSQNAVRTLRGDRYRLTPSAVRARRDLLSERSSRCTA